MSARVEIGSIASKEMGVARVDADPRRLPGAIRGGGGLAGQARTRLVLLS